MGCLCLEMKNGLCRLVYSINDGKKKSKIERKVEREGEHYHCYLQLSIIMTRKTLEKNIVFSNFGWKKKLLDF